MKYKLTDTDLTEIAQSFQKLLSVEYNILLGQKNRILTPEEIKITFNTSDFKHTVGLHKLKDKLFSSMASNTVFNDILKGKLNAKDITSSKHYTSEIEQRLISSKDLEKYLDSNTTIFRWNKSTAHSNINATYLVSANIGIDPVTNSAFIFLSDREPTTHNTKIVSFFPKTKDISERQPKLPTLLKAKILKNNEDKHFECKLLFILDSYRKSLEINSSELSKITPETQKILSALISQPQQSTLSMKDIAQVTEEHGEKSAPGRDTLDVDERV